MTGMELWSTTAANNNSASPNGFPENMPPSGVNDAARQMMAALRTWYETAEWVNLGNTPTYISANSFSVTGDQTTIYQVGRRIKLYGTTPFTLYGTITASAYASVTTITVSLDSGSLDSSLSTIYISINSVTNKSISYNMLSGSLLLGSATLATNGTLSNLIPADDTIPQNTEGDQIVTVSVTPTSASKTLLIKFSGYVSGDTAGQIATAALFVDTTANAIYANGTTIASINKPYLIEGSFLVSAASTTARTYKLRIGASTGVLYANGTAGSTRLYGGVSNISLHIYEF